MRLRDDNLLHMPQSRDDDYREDAPDFPTLEIFKKYFSDEWHEYCEFLLQIVFFIFNSWFTIWSATLFLSILK